MTTLKPPTPDTKSLAFATLVALGVALIVLVVAILPAEYGMDPTGIGGALGFTQLSASNQPPTNASGVVTTSNTTSTLHTYTSSFPLTVAQLQVVEGYSAEGETRMIPFQVTSPNVTRVIAELYFVDDNQTANQRTRPDTFEIELKAPSGDASGGVLVRSDPATSVASGRAVFSLRQAPYPRDLDEASALEARDAFARNDAPDKSGVGEWKARVTMLEAGGANASGVPLPGPAGAATDAGNSWKLTLKVETYALDVREKPGTSQREDSTTFLVPAGGELEYKLLVNLGSRLHYSWSTDGPPLYFDFHGDRVGDKSGAFTRHKGGTSASDEGTFTAPFDGRHGWYWRNQSGQDAIITLETRGTYDVIGRTL